MFLMTVSKKVYETFYITFDLKQVVGHENCIISSENLKSYMWYIFLFL